MNIVIFSGGTGSQELIRGLRYYSKDIFITNIINLYDDGKSTGICRRVCDVLGPSDMRKVHYAHYTSENEYLDFRILKIFEKRFDLGCHPDVHKSAKKTLLEFLDNLTDLQYLDLFKDYVNRFFDLAENKNIYDFNDFSLANVLYAMMFREIGIEKTNEFMKTFLHITKSNIVVNSYNNYILGAIAKSIKNNNEEILYDESSIVSYNKKNYRICKNIFYKDNEKTKFIDNYENLNPVVLETLNNADLIIYSSGTQWSSLLPTFHNYEILKCLSDNVHKSIFIMNNIDDKDMKGINSKELLDIFPLYKNMKILFNDDAIDLMKIKHEMIDELISFKHTKYYSFPLENNNGKHNAIKLATAVFQIYFGLERKKYSKLFIDFDDTLFSRNIYDSSLSCRNIDMLYTLSKIMNICILSGNSFKHIEDNINKCINKEILNSKNVSIWADACAIQYRYSISSIILQQLMINDTENVLKLILDNGLDDILKKLNVKISLRGIKDNISCINFKPLNELAKYFLRDQFNRYFEDYHYDLIAKEIGNTSLDIVRPMNSKTLAYKIECADYNMKENNDHLFIGDDPQGNDKEMFDICENSICVNSIQETYILLKMINYFKRNI